MINAILADDEPIIIKGLKKLIPWADLGINIVGEAWTGRGLLELIEKEKPQLVITDISMPDGTGIDVLKEIEKRQLRTKVIFISAYQEFSYAKDAVSFGALGYLVKPVEKEMLLCVIERAVFELQEESKKQTFKSQLAVYEQKDKKTQLEDVFERLIDGDILQEEAYRKIDDLDAGYYHEMYSVLILMPELPMHDVRWKEHENRLLLFAITNMANELIHREVKGLIIRRSDKLVVFVNHPHEYNISSLVNELIVSVKSHLKVQLAIGIGNVSLTLSELKYSYQTSEAAIENCIFAGEGSPVYWSENTDTLSNIDQEIHEIKHLILQSILAQEHQKLEEQQNTFFKLSLASTHGNKDRTIMIYYTSLLDWSEALRDLGVTDIWRNQQDWLEMFRSFRRYEEMKQYLRLQTDEMIRLIHPEVKGREAEQFQKVKEYIESHYMMNITLESCASIIFMNPYYFSSCFKKHTNMNFKQYLTEVRMKHALKLLLQTDLMVYEIAEQAGYSNPRQFSSMFKKQYGKLPQDFRNQK